MQLSLPCQEEQELQIFRWRVRRKWRKLTTVLSSLPSLPSLMETRVIKRWERLWFCCFCLLSWAGGFSFYLLFSRAAAFSCLFLLPWLSSVSSPLFSLSLLDDHEALASFCPSHQFALVEELRTKKIQNDHDVTPERKSGRLCLSSFSVSLSIFSFLFLSSSSSSEGSRFFLSVSSAALVEELSVKKKTDRSWRHNGKDILLSLFLFLPFLFICPTFPLLFFHHRHRQETLASFCQSYQFALVEELNAQNFDDVTSQQKGKLAAVSITSNTDPNTPRFVFLTVCLLCILFLFLFSPFSLSLLECFLYRSSFPFHLLLFFVLSFFSSSFASSMKSFSFLLFFISMIIIIIIIIIRPAQFSWSISDQGENCALCCFCLLLFFFFSSSSYSAPPSFLRLWRAVASSFHDRLSFCNLNGPGMMMRGKDGDQRGEPGEEEDVVKQETNDDDLMFCSCLCATSMDCVWSERGRGETN